MKQLKKNPILALFNEFLVDSPLPSNINYLYNFGSLLGLVLVIQILTGVFLAMHYTPHVDLAFNSVEHIMRDVNYGWLIRYAHANGASFFFICVYVHIGRGLYYGSYMKPRVGLWTVGVIIYILMMGIAFLGYVLPWGQMSFWGATVITNMFSAIPYLGGDIVSILWGGFSVDNPTLNRFFSLHFLLPFVLAALVIIHIIFLHLHGFKGPKFIRNLHFIIPNIRSNKRIGPHSSEIYEFLFGSLLGDAHAERLMSGGVRFRFKHSVIQKDYLFFKYYFLLEKGYVNNNPPAFLKDKLGDSYRFDTYCYSNLLWFYKIFYKNKIKVLPELNYLTQFLTPLALAIWIMDDGTFKDPGVRIAINKFTKKEGEIIIQVLRDKYNIVSSLHKNSGQYQLYIKNESMKILINLVKPYFHSTMYYKLGEV